MKASDHTKRHPRLLRHLALLATPLLLWSVTTSAQVQQMKNNTPTFRTVKGDPTATRIYTLPNGLKVYLSVNKEAPRVEAYIAVRVGGKNDPAETTGLAHYFEHIMFKGTKLFGTQNYAAEAPLLDKIAELFEQHRATQDEAEKERIYKQIDSVSYEASKYAIPNEYDKLMSTIGATGTNAYTSYDQTVYVEQIPSNQIDNWARIQADRFENPVVRGFHTELEAVYEEKNMSLTNDRRKMYEYMLRGLFPEHPYGKQTVLGTQYDLKNPSINNILAYHKKYYVPNNMAICMAGDLDPEATIAIIQKYFGHLKPNPELSGYHVAPLAYPTAPKTMEVNGPESAQVYVGWMVPGTHSEESDMLSLVSTILYNGKTGLIDKHLVYPQKVLSAFGTDFGLSDYNVFCLGGLPKEGQTLEEVQQLLLNEIEALKRGDFDEKILKASINNFKYSMVKKFDAIDEVADLYVQAFINDVEWDRVVGVLDKLSKVTKQDVVDFARKYFTANHCTVYKRVGEDTSIVTMKKPAITPIVTNRDANSDFFLQVAQTPVAPIAPVFVDYRKELRIVQSPVAKREILYKQNKRNDLFTLSYLFEPGLNSDKLLPVALRYLKYAGTDRLTPNEVNEALFDIAVDYTASVRTNRRCVTITGLQEQMEKAIQIVEEIFNRAKAEPESFKAWIDNELVARNNDLKSQDRNFAALQRYLLYGPEYNPHKVLTNKELKSITLQEVEDCIHKLFRYPHKVLYYGPASYETVERLLATHHPLPSKELKTPAEDVLPYTSYAKPKVLLAHYDAANYQSISFANLGYGYDLVQEPQVQLFNNYFGGGMNSIVFQELRESRALAYGAGAVLVSPSRLKDNYVYLHFITSQNDKLKDGFIAFADLKQNIPTSEKAFAIAKEGLLTQLRTRRISPANMAFTYISMLDKGLKESPTKYTYEQLQTLTLDDIVKYQRDKVRNTPFSYGILGNKAKLDMPYISTLGEVTELTQEQIFGY